MPKFITQKTLRNKRLEEDGDDDERKAQMDFPLHFLLKRFFGFYACVAIVAKAVEGGEVRFATREETDEESMILFKDFMASKRRHHVTTLYRRACRAFVRRDFMEVQRVQKILLVKATKACGGDSAFARDVAEEFLGMD